MFFAAIDHLDPIYGIERLPRPSIGLAISSETSVASELWFVHRDTHENVFNHQMISNNVQTTQPQK